MANRISKSLLLFTILLITASCCKESYGDININANNIRVINTYKFRNIGDAVTVNQKDYRIKCYLSENIIREISAYNDVTASLNYCEDNFVGLKKDIAKLYISCNQEIWNTTPGMSLDPNKIRIYENKFENDTENKRLRIEEWLNLVNNEKQLITFEWYIEFNDIIDTSEYLKFQLIFEIVDGSEYMTQTGSVKITQ